MRRKAHATSVVLRTVATCRIARGGTQADIAHVEHVAEARAQHRSNGAIGDAGAACALDPESSTTTRITRVRAAGGGARGRRRRDPCRACQASSHPVENCETPHLELVLRKETVAQALCADRDQGSGSSARESGAHAPATMSAPRDASAPLSRHGLNENALRRGIRGVAFDAGSNVNHRAPVGAHMERPAVHDLGFEQRRR